SMENSSYILDLNNNSQVQDPNAPSAPAVPSGNQADFAKTVSGDNFISFLSYDGDTKNLPLVLSTSSDLLNFGTIQPGEPIIRTLSLTVLPGSTQGYQVLSYQNHALEGDGGTQIPNTTCDNGACTPILPDIWAIPLTYGFGYRCDNLEGNGCDRNLKKDYYKSFANEKANEFPAGILEVDGSTKSQAIISYKVNVSGNQANKAYQTTIYHIATPDL
ncbi:MAG: hypothetical protein ACHQT7_02645, partial [Candidatus Levyibacteriota bacterium]